MASVIKAGNATDGVQVTSDNTGILELKTGTGSGTTAVTIGTNQAVTFAGRATNPTTISVGNATPSTSGSGVTFPATQSASTDANTLDDYEEGTWTPSVTSLGGTITTVGAVSGTYTKIGRTVVATYEVAITTAGTAASAIQIAGLPFTCATRAVGCGREVNLTGYITSGILAASSSTISVRYYDASYPGASGSQNTGTITYQV